MLDNITRTSCDKCETIFVMTDLNMPYMDGLELATNLRQIKNKKVIIALATAEDTNIQSNQYTLFD